jgi:hypothetical protein
MVPQIEETFLVSMKWDETDVSDECTAFIFRVEEQDKQKQLPSCF